MVLHFIKQVYTIVFQDLGKYRLHVEFSARSIMGYKPHARLTLGSIKSNGKEDGWYGEEICKDYAYDGLSYVREELEVEITQEMYEYSRNKLGFAFGGSGNDSNDLHHSDLELLLKKFWIDKVD